MIILLLSGLIIIDIIILFLIYVLNKHRLENIKFFEEMSVERQMLSDLRSSVEEQLKEVEQQNKKYLAKLNQLATEAEQEVKNGVSSIEKEMNNLIAKMSDKIKEQLSEFSNKQAACDVFIKKIEKEKMILQVLLKRAETLIKFFDGRLSYEEILEEIEDKKYQDARKLIAKGYKPETVAKELGLSVSEVKLIAGLTV